MKFIQYIRIYHENMVEMIFKTLDFIVILIVPGYTEFQPSIRRSGRGGAGAYPSNHRAGYTLDRSPAHHRAT